MEKTEQSIKIEEAEKIKKIEETEDLDAELEKIANEVQIINE